MYLSKENFSSASHFKSPYSRQTVKNYDSTISNIVSKSRTSKNNFGRSFLPAKPLGARNSQSNVQTLQNYNDQSFSHSNSHCNYYNHMDNTNSLHSSVVAESVHFHPRKSQLRNCKPENTSHHSVELKMMNVGDGSETSKFKPAKATIQKGFQTKSRQNLLKIFTGSVENILYWSKLKNNLQVLFEVTGELDSPRPGKWKSEKIFYLRDSKSSCKLQVTYYEIDRPLPKLVTNSLVTCTGRLLTRNRLQAYKVEECTEETNNNLQRLSFICNIVADEIVAAEQKTD